jgi:hypothetical protein
MYNDVPWDPESPPPRPALPAQPQTRPYRPVVTVGRQEQETFIPFWPVTLALHIALAVSATVAYTTADDAEKNTDMGVGILAYFIQQYCAVLVTIATVLVTWLSLGKTAATATAIFYSLQAAAGTGIAIFILVKRWAYPCDDLTGFICNYSRFLVWFFFVTLCVTAFLIVVILIGFATGVVTAGVIMGTAAAKNKQQQQLQQLQKQQQLKQQQIDAAITQMAYAPF